MQAVVFPYNESKELQKILDLAHSLKIAFRIREVDPIEPDEGSLETITVRARLTEKYVNTGLWSTMDEEEREDAALVEMMKYTQEDLELNQPAFPESETRQYLMDLKSGKYAPHHQ